VSVIVGVLVGVLDGVWVPVGVLVGVPVAVGVSVGGSVGVGVLVFVGVSVFVGVFVLVGVADSVGTTMIWLPMPLMREVRNLSTMPSRQVLSGTTGHQLLMKGTTGSKLKLTMMRTRSPGPPASSIKVLSIVFLQVSGQVFFSQPKSPSVFASRKVSRLLQMVT
jgi:hypothetical protein